MVVGMRSTLSGLRATPATALLPLRLFLGGTFVYAGIQKLSDPGFLHPGASTYIGTQLSGFASGTPGGFLLRAFALPHAELAGTGVALLEIALGLLVLAGLLTRGAALVGLGLSLLLFLTASWRTSPYFLGPDIVFAFAWVPFVLAGADGQPSLSSVIEGRARRATRGRTRTPARGRTRTPAASAAPAGMAVSRRRLLTKALGAAGAATLGLAGVSVAAKGPYRGSGLALTGKPGGGASAAGAPASPKGAHPGRPARAAKLPKGAVRIGPSGSLPSGQGAIYRDPSDGQPDLVIRDSGGGLNALSAVCTHAGCTVGYQNGQIACPCHGATYDAQTGAVTSGPAPQSLAAKRVVEHQGQIYAVPS
jgi:thiosulfate dehydrogenase [quinone] large subunit